MSDDPAPRLHTIPEVAEHLQVSPKTIRRWIAQRALPVHVLGRQHRISGEDLAAFVNRARRP